VNYHLKKGPFYILSKKGHLTGSIVSAEVFTEEQADKFEKEYGDKLERVPQ